MSSRQWALLIGGSCCALVLLLQAPQWLHMANPAYQGIQIPLNADEAVYMARVEEALQGRPLQTDNAFTDDPAVHGTQSAFLEAVVGTIFRQTGLRAASVLQIMDGVTGVMLFLLLFLFLRLCGFSRVLSYSGTVGFCLIELYNLNRPIHQGLSFALVLTSLCALMMGLRGRRVCGYIGGAVLGVLLGVYLWSWTYAWLWVGLLFMWELVESLTSPEGKVDARKRLRQLCMFLLMAIVCALPFILLMLAASRSPHFAAATFRSGIYPGHLPESLPYSVLFLLMLGCVLLTMRAHLPRMRQYRYACITVIASAVAIHQQLIHGVVFNFVSHYLFAMALAAICLILLALTLRTRLLWLGAAAASVYLLALAYDGRYIVHQWTVSADEFSEQHLASVLPVLDRLPRSKVLSDPHTELFIAGYSKHDVLYAIYLKNLLLSHQEIAERYCLTQFAVPPEKRKIAEQQWLIYPDANGAFHSKDIRNQEVAMVEEACSKMDRDPSAFLKRYGVQYVLWNKREAKMWDSTRFPEGMKKEAEGEGWELWRL